MKHWLRAFLIAWLDIAASGLSPEDAALVKSQDSSEGSAPGMAHGATINQHKHKQIKLRNADSRIPDNAAMLAKRKTKTDGDSKETNGKHNRQLPGLLPGIEHQSTVSACLSSSFGALVAVLLVVAILLFLYLLRQLQKKAVLQTKVRANLAKLHAERRLLAEENEKLQTMQALEQEEKVLIKAIHDRGNVFFNEGRREFLLQKEIAFMSESKGKGEKSRAHDIRFADPVLAKAILSDLVELLRIFKSFVVLIEGHTQGVTLVELGDYEHDVADERANLVKSILVQLGIPEFRLTTLGLPGFLGNGKDDIVLKLIN